MFETQDGKMHETRGLFTFLATDGMVLFTMLKHITTVAQKQKQEYKCLCSIADNKHAP